MCGLAGAFLAVLGIHVWQLVQRLELSGEHVFGRTEGIAETINGLLWESGTLAALSVIAYLLAPKAHHPGPADPAEP